ncbi:small ribosomal subunit protein uS3m-like [Glandiceps talaboti]
MAASMRVRACKDILLRLYQPVLLQETRYLQVSAVCCKKRAGHVKVGKGDKPVTYEQANPPYRIGSRKTWNSINTANLHEEEGAPETAVEDLFVRRFLHGTFHGCLAAESIIKRKANHINVCLLLKRSLAPSKYYFLIAYSEALLTSWFKCVVKIEVQIVDHPVIYKWL